MAMNLLKLQDELKGMADDYLLQHIQQPTGEIPQFMVAAEMQRRKEMREQQAQQAPETTVVDDLEQQGLAALQPPPPAEAPAPAPEQMEQGVAGLPTNMPEVPQSMAGGGIVAFAGKDSSLVEGGGYIELTAAQYNQLIPAEKQKYVEQYGAPPEGARRELNPLEKALGIDKRQTLLQKYIAEGTPLVPQAQGPVADMPVFEPAEMRPGPQRPMPVPRVVEQAPPGLAGLPTAPEPAFSADTVTFNPITSADRLYDEMKRPQVPATEAMAQIQDLIGTDEGLAALKEKLQGMETKAATEEEQAPWMALLRAGLGMAAGTSPHALSNIATGGIEGVKEYAQAKERLDAKQEKRFELETRIAQSERAEKVAAAKHGYDSEQADKARADTIQLAKIKSNADMAIENAKTKVEVEKINATNKREARQLNITEKHYNDMYKLGVLQTNNSLKVMEKQDKRDQVAMLNNLLDEANTRVTRLVGDIDATPEQKIEAQARLDTIQKRLMTLTGIEYTGATAATTLPAGVTVKRN